jgi:hypothetical protein
MAANFMAHSFGYEWKKTSESVSVVLWTSGGERSKWKLM